MSARQVSDSSKFTEIVERVWNEKHPDKRILSLNLGLAGQSNQTYISFGRNMDRVFRPDLVFVMSNYDDFRQLAERKNLVARIAAGSDEPLTAPAKASKIDRLADRFGLRAFCGQLQRQTFGFLQKGTTPAAPVAPPSAEDSAAKNAAFQLQLRALKEI